MRMVVFDDEAAIGRLVVRVGALVGLEAAAVSDVEAFRSSLLDAPPQIGKQSKRGMIEIAAGIGHTAGERVGRMFWNTSDIAAAIGFDPREPLGALLG